MEILKSLMLSLDEIWLKIEALFYKAAAFQAYTTKQWMTDSRAIRRQDNTTSMRCVNARQFLCM